MVLSTIPANAATNWTPFITTIMGAVIGFISAAVLEVWKTGRTTRKRAVALEHALYAEMAQLYRVLYRLEDKPDVEQKLILNKIRTDSYRFAKQNPDLFHSLKYAFRIEAIYGQLDSSNFFTETDVQFIHGEPILPEYRELFRLTFIEAFTKEIEMAVRMKDLNLKLFKKASPSVFRDIVERAEQDKSKYGEGKPPLGAYRSGT